MIRRLKDWAAMELARRPGALAAISRFREDSLRIVYYHMVDGITPEHYPSRAVAPDVFRRQIRYLKRRFELITLSEAWRRARDGESLRGALAVTTDDGFAQNYTVIAPILAEEGVRATFFLISGCLDNRALMWRNKLQLALGRLDEERLGQLMRRTAGESALPPPRPGESAMNWSLREWPAAEKDRLADRFWEAAGLGPIGDWLAEHRPYMTSAQVRELLAEGFEIGAHTRTHPVCGRLGYEELAEETVGSARDLEAMFGVPVRLLAYPFGIRPEPRLERALVQRNGDRLAGLLGIGNRLDNYRNPYVWERDPMELDYAASLLMFHAGPLKRYWRHRLMPERRETVAAHVPGRNPDDEPHGRTAGIDESGIRP